MWAVSLVLSAAYDSVREELVEGAACVLKRETNLSPGAFSMSSSAGGGGGGGEGARGGLALTEFLTGREDVAADCSPPMSSHDTPIFGWKGESVPCFLHDS